MLAQQTILSCLLDGGVQTLYRNGVLCADIDITLIGTDGIACDGHGLQYHVGIALQNRTVHEGARVTLIRVTTDVFLHLSAVAGCELPFQAGGEACASTAAEAAVQNGLNDFIRSHLCQHLTQCLIAVTAYVLINILRVNDTTVAQRDTRLHFIKGCIL